MNTTSPHPQLKLFVAFAVLTYIAYASIPSNKEEEVNLRDLAFCLGLFSMMAPLFIWPLYRSYSAGSLGDIDSKSTSSPSAKSLEHILADPEAHTAFKNFVTSEFSVENLMFYDAVQDFKEVFEAETPQDNRELAQGIYTDFVSPGSPFQVNLPSTVVSTLAQLLRPQLITTSPALAQHIDERRSQMILQNVFDVAVVNIVELMRRDSYQRFLRSSYYRRLCRHRQSRAIVNRTLFELEPPQM
jgi:hypothetical protein